MENCLGIQLYFNLYCMRDYLNYQNILLEIFTQLF